MSDDARWINEDCHARRIDFENQQARFPARCYCCGRQINGGNYCDPCTLDGSAAKAHQELEVPPREPVDLADFAEDGPDKFDLPDEEPDDSKWGN